MEILQWPAMVVTLGSSWLVGSESETKRRWGFWAYLLSNALWLAWGLDAKAYALVALQVCLAIMNVRGANKNKED